MLVHSAHNNYPVIKISISSNTVDYNLHNDLRDNYSWDEVSLVWVVITIETGIKVTSSVASIAAFTTGVIPEGSYVKIVNKGSIIGAGGAGGASITLAAAQNGGDGGDAIDAGEDILIDNTDGFIFGGGGGGGGGGHLDIGGLAFPGGCGGGGAGDVGGPISSNTTIGGGFCNIDTQTIGCRDGVVGTTVGGGYGYGNYSSCSNPFEPCSVYWPPNGQKGGRGGQGGEYGAVGEDGTFPIWSGSGRTGYAQGTGGAAGKAVELNSNNITWISGNTTEKVKGAAS